MRENRLVLWVTSSSPLYLPKAFEWTIMVRVEGMANQPMSNSGSGSQAPRKCHLPSTHTSTQAWLSSVCAQRGV